MTLEGDRVVLRAVEPEDADLLYQWENDATLWQDSSAIAPYSKYQLKTYIETAGDIYALRQLRLMISRKRDGLTIGCVDLFEFEPRHGRAELGILIDKDFRRKGYATEALALIEVYAFRLFNLHQLYCYVSRRNEPSQRLFYAAGFQLGATLHDWFRNEDWEDALLFQKMSHGCKIK